jgi:hypothetical protein
MIILIPLLVLFGHLIASGSMLTLQKCLSNLEFRENCGITAVHLHENLYDIA